MTFSVKQVPKDPVEYLDSSGKRVDILSAIENYKNIMNRPLEGCESCRTTKDHFLGKDVIKCTGESKCQASAEALRKRAFLFQSLLENAAAEILRLRLIDTEK